MAFYPALSRSLSRALGGLPATLLGPLTIVNCTFTAADGTLLINYLWLGVGDVRPGLNQWVAMTFSQPKVVGNQAALVVDQNRGGAAIETGVSDCTISIITTPTNAGASGSNISGVYFRRTDDNNYYKAIIDANLGQFKIVERTTSTETIRASIAFVPVLGQQYTVVVVLSGASMVATVDGGSTLSYSSAVRQVATNHGFGLRVTTDRADNFKVTVP